MFKINETSQKLDFFNETKIKKLKVNIYQHNEIFTIDHKGGEIVIKNPSLGYSGHSGMSNKLIKIFYDEEQKKYFAKCDKFPLHIKIFSHIKLDPGKRFVFNLGKEPIEIKIIQSNDIEIKTINGTHKFSKDDVPIRVGRHNSNSVYLEDQSVSKIHAIIEKVEDNLIFRDNKSTNGSDWIIHVGELYQISTLNVFSFGDDNYIRIDEFDEN